MLVTTNMQVIIRMGYLPRLFDFMLIELRLGKGQHPMKPHRMRMVHDLIINYDLHKKLDVCVREPLSFVLQALKYGLFTDYKTCDLAGND